MSRRNARWLDFLSQFVFTILHVPGKSNVADYLSRVPGMESLEPEVLCNHVFSCGLPHIDDVGASKNRPYSDLSLNNIISVYDDSTLLSNIKKS